MWSNCHNFFLFVYFIRTGRRLLLYDILKFYSSAIIIINNSIWSNDFLAYFHVRLIWVVIIFYHFIACSVGAAVHFCWSIPRTAESIHKSSEQNELINIKRRRLLKCAELFRQSEFCLRIMAWVMRREKMESCKQFVIFAFLHQTMNRCSWLDLHQHDHHHVCFLLPLKRLQWNRWWRPVIVMHLCHLVTTKHCTDSIFSQLIKVNLITFLGQKFFSSVSTCMSTSKSRDEKSRTQIERTINGV